MKKLFALLVILSLVPFSVHAEYTPGSTFLQAVEAVKHAQANANSESKNVSPLILLFIEYANQLKTASYNAVNQSLQKTGQKYNTVIPTNNDFGKHEIEDENGYLLVFQYYPLDYSFDSKDFGNPDKEMLCLVELSKNGNSIAVSDNLHTGSISYSSHCSTATPRQQTYASIDSLFSFYKTNMDGTLPAQESMSSYSSKPSSNQEETKITALIRSRCKEMYDNASVSDIQINYSSVDAYGADKIVLVTFNYSQANSPKFLISLLETFSDDLASSLAKKTESIKELYVFWEAPESVNVDICAKYSYEFVPAGAYRQSQSGKIYDYANQ